jgi:hypothetical protein
MRVYSGIFEQLVLENLLFCEAIGFVLYGDTDKMTSSVYMLNLNRIKPILI